MMNWAARVLGTTKKEALASFKVELDKIETVLEKEHNPPLPGEVDGKVDGKLVAKKHPPLHGYFPLKDQILAAVNALVAKHPETESLRIASYGDSENYGGRVKVEINFS